MPFLSRFTNVTWNYSEKSHAKGAPDGIGGAIKREADLYVNRGGGLQTPKTPDEMRLHSLLVTSEMFTLSFQNLSQQPHASQS